MGTEVSGTIEFLENHQTVLPPGDYTLSVTQEISAENIRSENKFNATLKFSVLSPRFTLDPQEIQAVFPPPVAWAIMPTYCPISSSTAVPCPGNG